MQRIDGFFQTLPFLDRSIRSSVYLAIPSEMPPSTTTVGQMDVVYVLCVGLTGLLVLVCVLRQVFRCFASLAKQVTYQTATTLLVGSGLGSYITGERVGAWSFLEAVLTTARDNSTKVDKSKL